MDLLKCLDKAKMGTNRAKPVYDGSTIFESAQAGERVLWLATRKTKITPIQTSAKTIVRVELTQNQYYQSNHDNGCFIISQDLLHCPYPALSGFVSARFNHKRPEDGIVLVTPKGRCAVIRNVFAAVRIKFSSTYDGRERAKNVSPVFRKIEPPQCFVNCIGKIRLAGFLNTPDKANPENPLDYLVHIKSCTAAFSAVRIRAKHLLHSADSRSDLIHQTNVRSGRWPRNQTYPRSRRQ